MRLDLTEILTSTGADLLRWPGCQQGLLPVHDPGAAGPGTVWFPVYQREVTRSALERVAQQGAEGVALPGDAARAAEPFPALGVLLLPSPFRGYTALAAEARRRSGAYVVGITGSSGKSSTKEYLVRILGRGRPVIGTTESLNLYQDCAGLLLSLSGQPSEAAVIEMGFGWEGDIERMASLAQPSAGIILKVTSAHEDGTGGSWTRLIHEKGRLGVHIPADGVRAVHAEDPGCARLPFAYYRARVLRFGAGPKADVRYSRVRTSEAGTEVHLDLFGLPLDCRLQACGRFHAANAAAAALIAHTAGVPVDEIREGLESTPPAPRRFQIHRYQPGLTVIDDSFNATADGMLRGLEEAARLAGPRRRIAVLSGVAKLGGRSEALNRIIGQHAVACGFEEVVLVRDEWSRSIHAGLLAAGLPAERIRTVGRNTALPETLLRLTGPDQLIYCKARYAGEALDLFRARLADRGFTPVNAD